MKEYRPHTPPAAQRKEDKRLSKAASVPNRTGLPDNLKAGIESLSGYAMNDVKVHYNSAQPANLQAHAYAQGTDIHVAPGQERHLPHEAWHVVQQKQGRVGATRSHGGMPVNDTPALEKEADRMGEQAGRTTGSLPEVQSAQVSPVTNVVQMQEPYDRKAKERWDEIVERIRNWIRKKYREMVAKEQVEFYLEFMAGIDNPRGPYFELDDEDEFDDYIYELTHVSPEDVYSHINGSLEESEDERPKKKVRKEGAKDRKKKKKKVEEVYNGTDAEIKFNEDDELHYSSEDDEVPEKRQEFDRIVSIIQILNKLLNAHMEKVEGLGEYEKEVQTIVTNIDLHRKEKKGTFPKKFNPVSVGSLGDFQALAQSINKAKGKKDQTKPTSFNYQMDIWDEPKYNEVMFRGKQLKDPYGNAGRSWAAISMSLHKMAYRLGNILTRGLENVAVRHEVGNRALATAMLFILAGKGNRIKNILVDGYKVDESVLHEFEALCVEFFTLTLGVENIRLPFTQLDTILHLSRIAKHEGFGPKKKPYTFLNTFSSGRVGAEGAVTAFIPGRYQWKMGGKNKQTEKAMKELTTYQGFKTIGLKELTEGSNQRGEKRSAKSVGKSMYSHSAGHNKVDKFFKKDKTVIDELYKQVRPVDEKENRRKLHEKRLYVMGPLRVYNLFAGLIQKHADLLEKMDDEKIAGLIFEAFDAFIKGDEPDSRNPFSEAFLNVSEDIKDLHKPEVRMELEKDASEKEDMEWIQEHLLQVNNCLINSVAIGGMGRRATFEELVEIRSQLLDRGFPVGSMLVASPAILDIIRTVLGIPDRGIVVYYRGQEIPEDRVDGNRPIIIDHNGVNHFEARTIARAKPLKKDENKDEKR